MRFGAKIGLVLLAVGVVPVAVLGRVAYSASREELERTVGGLQAQGAADLALFTERFLRGALEGLRLSTVALSPLGAFSQGELTQLLGIPFRQLGFVSILAVVDDAGVPVAGPVYVRRPELDAALSGRAPVSDEDLDRFARRLPRAPAAPGEAATSTPYRGSRGPAKLAVVLRLAPNRALAAEVSLGEVESRIAELSSDGAVAWLVDGDGELLAHGGPEPSLSPAERGLAREVVDRARPLSRVVERADGHPWLAGFAPVRGWGWGAAVAQPAATGLAAAEVVRLRTTAGAGGAMVIALLVGWVVARRVTRRVERLSEAAGAIAQGEYASSLAPVDVEGDDEIAGLGRAFARMAGELRRRDEEIRAFNADLQRRVEERTTELHAAQEQIQRTRRLAALGSLGAGVAHELNNPMTAVNGYLAVLARELEDAPQATLVARAREQAARVSAVVEDLRAFADQERHGAGQRFSLVRPVEAALALYDDRLRAARIEVATRFEAPLPEAQGDPVQIQQVVAHLVDNALHAMPEGGRLSVTVGAVDGDALKLTVADTGKGIPAALRDRIFDPFFTLKEDRTGRVGLGLSVSHRIVEAHHGRILVESEEGLGASVTVLLPAAAAPHLA